MSPSFRTRAAELTTRLLGAPPVGAAWRRLRPGLRILAYHGVPDSARFAEHLELIASTYAPVSGKQVMAARRGDAVLPDRALWVTFDDGDPSVVAHATDALTQRRIPATLFVCPGLIVNKRAPWWEIVLEAGRRSHGAAIDGRNLVGTSLVTALKSVPDSQRRDICAEIEQAAGPLPIEALSLDELGRWQQAGLEIGNHTWDHPCLDRCTPEEQTQQIRRAHDWLDEHFQPRCRCSPTRTATTPITPRASCEPLATTAGCCSTTVSTHQPRRSIPAASCRAYASTLPVRSPAPGRSSRASTPTCSPHWAAELTAARTSPLRHRLRRAQALPAR